MTSFLAKNGTQILLQPPYFPDIAPNDFFLFPKLKAVLKGRHFDTRDGIIEKSPLALKSIPKEAYKNCFDNWEKRWRWCVEARGDYFEKLKSLIEIDLLMRHSSNNVQLGVEVEMLRKELDQKTVELEAAKAAAPPTTNLQQLVQENQVLSGKLEEHRTKTDQLEQMLAQACQEVAELTETLQEATQETGLLRSQLEATQQDMEAQQKTVSELEQALQDKDQELRESLEAQEDQARRLEEALKKVAKRNKIIQGLSQQSLASFLTASPSELVEQLVKLCGGSQEEVGRRLTVLTDTLGPNHLSPKTNPNLEQECKNLHSALTEKDRFIKELLEERNRIRQENESSLRGYFSTLQQKQDYIQELESTINKYKSSDGDLLELLKKEGLELNGTVLLSDHVSVILKLLDQKESLSGGEKVLAALLDEYHRFEDLKVAEEKLQADRVHMMLELAEKNEQHAAAMNQLEKEHGEVVARLEQDKEELSARVRDEGPPLIDIGDPGAAELQQQLEQKAEEVDRLLMRQRELKLELVQAISQLQDTQRENAKLREEAKVLVAHLEEQDAFLQKLEPPASEDVEELRQQLALSKQCSELLQRRLEELADFLEALLDNRDTLELSTASVSRMRACLEETRNLSMSLSHHIHASETSAIFTLDQTAADMTHLCSLCRRNRDAMGDAKLLLFSLEESRRRTSIAAVDKTSSGTDPNMRGRPRRVYHQQRVPAVRGHVGPQDRVVVLDQAGSDSESLMLVLDDRGQPQDVQMVRMMPPPIPEQQASCLSSSESDLWSEPDRAVSLQRLGLTPTLAEGPLRPRRDSSGNLAGLLWFGA
ncbi:hypothetical protein LAZ67_2003550 [Cordylochernes scorpioides]|uniref:Uncharacterized protein n=1 Tax=Cordylochernes scorpioides TaxID=51811 RepID=A0ABY6K4N8_9ARAC|nr:hypothetical protein LAZ67_2003550 [Cordylochernes scorpioides]